MLNTNCFIKPNVISVIPTINRQKLFGCPSGRTMVLGSTQPLTGMSTTNISWGAKDGRYVRRITLAPSCADCLEIWEPQPPGTV